MLLVLILFLLFISSCLVLLKQHPVALYDVFYGITTHVNHTFWWSQVGMSRFTFHSHHASQCLFFPHPVKAENWREDLYVVVCPWVCYWAYYPHKVPLTISAASQLKSYMSCSVIKVNYSGFVSVAPVLA